MTHSKIAIKNFKKNYLKWIILKNIARERKYFSLLSVFIAISISLFKNNPSHLAHYPMIKTSIFFFLISFKFLSSSHACGTYVFCFGVLSSFVLVLFNYKLSMKWWGREKIEKSWARFEAYTAYTYNFFFFF